MNQSAPRVSAEHVHRFVNYLAQHAKGRANAKSARVLSRGLCLGKNGDRILRAFANAATESGIIVCTGNKGYWLPETPADAEETIGRLYSQGAEMIRRANALRALIAAKSAQKSQQMSLLG